MTSSGTVRQSSITASQVMPTSNSCSSSDNWKNQVDFMEISVKFDGRTATHKPSGFVSNFWADLTNQHGQLPTHLAAREGYLDLLKLLLESGASVSVAVLHSDTFRSDRDDLIICSSHDLMFTIAMMSSSSCSSYIHHILPPHTDHPSWYSTYIFSSSSGSLRLPPPPRGCFFRSHRLR